MALTPEQRSLRARVAAHSMHAQGKTNTGPATRAAAARFEKMVDPEGKLDPAERAKRAEHAKKAFFAGMALKSAKVRADRRAKGK